MGDRSTVVFIDNGEVSPSCYSHWGGPATGTYIQLAKSGCPGVIGAGDAIAQYVIASSHNGVAAVRLFNTQMNIPQGPDWFERAYKELSERGSCGDAGRFIVDVRKADWRVTAHDGYGFREYVGEETDDWQVIDEKTAVFYDRRSQQ